jgi:hypothetical protein
VVWVFWGIWRWGRGEEEEILESAGERERDRKKVPGEYGRTEQGEGKVEQAERRRETG